MIEKLLENKSTKNIYILNILSLTHHLIRFVSLSNRIKLTNIACISSERKL